MIVRKLSELLGTEREVTGETWTSRRLLLSADGMGFSLHDTTMLAGTTTEMHYQNHLEAVYCLEGRGRLQNVSTGEEFIIEPGTVYALNEHDRHVFITETDMRFVCVFNPALFGPEVHNAEGAYPLLNSDNA